MSHKRNIYLRTVPIPEALERVKSLLNRAALVGVEKIPTEQALGRVTASPVTARLSSPTFHCAAMDGIAVRGESTFAAREGSPVTLSPGEGFALVNTGQPLPPGFDAVAMIEHVVFDDAGNASLETPVAPWTHVRRIGEDIVATELILPRRRKLTAYDLGALLSCGVWEVDVYEQVRMAVIPTGDEVLDYTSRPEPGPGQVVESNSVMLCALAQGWGLDARRRPPVRDEPGALARAVEEALNSPAHVVAILAGSSAGSKDFTRAVMERFGEVAVHGIQAMPGKPSLLGVAQGKLLVGAPGYPVSAVVCFEELLAPLAAWLSRCEPARRPSVPVRLAKDVPSRPGLTEFLRLAAGRVGEGYSAIPLSRGAGLITTLTKAQAVARIAQDREGVARGEVVQAELLVSQDELERTLVVVGSHDNTLDLLADELMRLDSPLRLASSHVGSLGGLTALAQGAALLAGAHLLDTESGDFNFPFIARHLPGVEVAVINLAIRHQGLMVAPGNPKEIQGVGSLARPDVRFVNRQRGAGTRILLDYNLKLAGIAPSQVQGYAQEETTHMGVAANVKNGAADCGLGVFSAAKALGLDFVPLARERYDLVLPLASLEEPRVQTLLAVLGDKAFQGKIAALGGYETTWTGRRMEPGMGLPPDNVDMAN
ncbi:Molybdopterin molybdenumtransferase [Fundidesulfovibrio magnetotacticus]|uniref:Molybdopterin molybdenumtransferase n=1 Tax=Fundidesulfovibrio magnetotacticus TaxID=2730080 RepID=A0A6V8LM01_9BACT|nr:molybdopterin biosynthesis protein [Fundidesulfovibrio magnetotacticus]GFK93713.1 Molybdopterin molybdenumtransferase [Fundidesulfovibrio magnetotacticus]